MIPEFIKKHAAEYTDSTGEIDTLGLIELVQKEFGCTTHNAEEYVYETLELE